MSEDKKNRQQLACEFIHDNYVAFNRLRFDEIAQKVQIRDAAEPQCSGEGNWRYITNADINTMVCDCSAETGANITSKEVLTVLNAGSQYIPRVHPLREYIQSLPTWLPESGDWIDFVAQQVRVKSNDNKLSGNNNDNTDNLRPNQYPLGAQGEKKIQQHEQLDSTTFRSQQHSERLGDNLNDNTDNLQSTPKSRLFRGPRGNQLPAAPEENNPTPHYTTLPNPTSTADALWRACFKKWFVAMVASWMNDEVVNHQVLVLIGRQGIYKTTWLERLIPPHLRQYCCKLANATQLTKDDRLRIAEFGLINMDELDAMTPRELNAMKSVITASDVNERVAYGYTKERRMRLASFCASSNRREFLTDITGNRRWLPFEVESIQNPFFTTLPYDLMYAQAYALMQDPSFSYWFDLDEITQMEEHNEAFRAQDSEEQLLPILFDVPAEGRGEFMTTAQISERLVSYGNIKKPMSVSRLGMLLGTAGYKAVTRGTRTSRIRGWIVYQRDSDEIVANKKILATECVTV